MSRPEVPELLDEGGDAACWANLVCEICGRIPDAGEPHECTPEPGPDTGN